MLWDATIHRTDQADRLQLPELFHVLLSKESTEPCHFHRDQFGRTAHGNTNNRFAKGMTIHFDGLN